jgi:hypothetical protein
MNRRGRALVIIHVMQWQRLGGGIALALAWAAMAWAAPSGLYFSDSFEGSEHYFYEGTLDQRDFSYLEGEYEIDTLRASAYGQSILVEDLDNYRVEVAARLADTSDPDGGGLGLSFNYRERETGAADFLLLLVYNRGAFAILRYYNGQTSTLYSPTKTELFKPGEEVILTVDNDGGRIKCFINNAEIAAVTEQQLTSGGVGVFATARSRARFDDFKVYADTPAPAGGFTDTFDTPGRLFDGEWGEVKYSYQDGSYLIDTTGTDFIGLSPYPEEVKNFELSADVEAIAGQPTGGIGLYLRDYAQPDGGFNQYRFLISGGWFAVEQSIDDMPLALATWAEHSAVRAGAVNRLKVRALDGELAFYINGVEVYRCADEHPRAGAFGLYACARVKAAFDNVEFKEL